MKKNDKNIQKILLVDANVNNLILLKEMLAPMLLNFYIAISAEEALKRIDENDFDIILLDTGISEFDGYEICREIKNNKTKCDIPVLLISSFNSIEDKVKGYDSGADDYLIKPLSSNEVFARVQIHLQKQIALKHMKGLLKRSYHELYNPLAVIKTSVEMFEIHNEPNRHINLIHAAAKSLHVIYEDLYYALSLTKDLEIKESISLDQFVRDRVVFFNLLAEVKGIEFIINADLDLYVNMSNSEIQRIIDNTLSNAIKYAFENTKIIITLNNNNGIELSISNQGNNIESPEHIFTEGYREDYEKSGMGIGLEIVASICNKYEIKTMVFSERNITTFTYIFPEHDINFIKD